MKKVLLLIAFVSISSLHAMKNLTKKFGSVLKIGTKTSLVKAHPFNTVNFKHYSAAPTPEAELTENKLKKIKSFELPIPLKIFKSSFEDSHVDMLSEIQFRHVLKDKTNEEIVTCLDEIITTIMEAYEPRETLKIIKKILYTEEILAIAFNRENREIYNQIYDTPFIKHTILRIMGKIKPSAYIIQEIKTYGPHEKMLEGIFESADNALEKFENFMMISLNLYLERGATPKQAKKTVGDLFIASGIEYKKTKNRKLKKRIKLYKQLLDRENDEESAATETIISWPH